MDRDPKEFARLAAQAGHEALDMNAPTISQAEHARIVEHYKGALAKADARVEELKRLLETSESHAASYKRDLDAEMEGNLALRKQFGARDNETMFGWLQRIHSEKIEVKGPQQYLDAVIKLGTALDPELWGTIPPSTFWEAIRELEGRVLRLRDVERDLRVAQDRAHTAEGHAIAARESRAAADAACKNLNLALAEAVEVNTRLSDDLANAKNVNSEHATRIADLGTMLHQTVDRCAALDRAVAYEHAERLSERKRAREFARGLVAATTVIDALGSMASQDPVFEDVREGAEVEP